MLVAMPKIGAEGFSSASLDFSAARGTMIYQALASGGLAAYEPDTVALAAALIAFFHLTRFSDVGANIGLYSLVLTRLNRGELRTRAFEPLPSLVEIFRTLIAANELSIGIVAAAVGATAGDALLHVSSRSDSSNSLNPVFRPSKECITVPLITLDEDAGGSGHFPQLLKIDTESTEPDVLNGASRLIEKHRPWIICEVLKDRTEVSLQTIFRRHNYLSYHIDGSASLNLRDRIVGDHTHQHRDWLFAPHSLPREFNEYYLAVRTAFREASL